MSCLVAIVVFVQFSTTYISSFSGIPFKYLIPVCLATLVYYKALLQPENYKYSIFILLFTTSVLLSAFINQGVYTQTILTSLGTVTKMLLLVLFIQISKNEGCLKENFKIIFFILLVFCVISDALAVVNPHITYSYWGERYSDYLVGSKFSLSYMHFWLAVMFTYLFENRIKLKYALYLWVFVIAIYSECSTMIVGMSFFIMMSFVGDRMSRILYSKSFMIAFLVACNTLLIIGSSILQVPIVQKIIIGVLHENATLSGRMNIYNSLGALLLVNPFVGVSFDSNYVFSSQFVNAANFQNGILDNYVSYGCLGILLLLCVLVYFNSLCKKYNDKFFLYAVYMFILLSSVEITFRASIYYMILVGIALIEMKNQDNCAPIVKEN